MIQAVLMAVKVLESFGEAENMIDLLRAMFKVQDLISNCCECYV